MIYYTTSRIATQELISKILGYSLTGQVGEELGNQLGEANQCINKLLYYK